MSTIICATVRQGRNTASVCVTPTRPKACCIIAKNGALEPWWHEYDSEDRTRALECLRRMGMADHATRPFGSLSSGEQQRVLLARSLMNDPICLLLDEPSARLDLGGREHLVRILDGFANDNPALPSVIVTHHVDEIPVSTTHMLMMRDGATTVAGPVADVLTSANLCRWVIDFHEIALGQQVGMGSYGVVFKGKWKGVEVAVKRGAKLADAWFPSPMVSFDNVAKLNTLFRETRAAAGLPVAAD